MISCKKEAKDLVKWINSLQEPYKENTIAWLKIYIRRPMDDMQQDIEGFLRELDPVVRDYFLIHTRMLLKTAAHYFGDKELDSFTAMGDDSEEPYKVPSMVG